MGNMTPCIRLESRCRWAALFTIAFSLPHSLLVAAVANGPPSSASALASGSALGGVGQGRALPEGFEDGRMASSTWGLFHGYARPHMFATTLGGAALGLSLETNSHLFAKPAPTPRLVRRAARRAEVSGSQDDLDEMRLSVAAEVSARGALAHSDDVLPGVSAYYAGIRSIPEKPTSAAALDWNHSKLFIIMTGNRPVNAIMAQSSWIRHLRWPDKVLFACGSHCREDPRLDSVVIVPDLLLDTHHTQPWDYRQASMRAPWALQWAWRTINRTGSGSHGTDLLSSEELKHDDEHEGYGLRLASKPFKWWIVADDDTFINLPLLEQVLERYNTSEPIVLAQGKRQGGAGIAITEEAVRRFVPSFWSEYVPAWRDKHAPVYGDNTLVGQLERLGATAVDQKEFTQYAPSEEQLASGEYRKSFATWHHAWEAHEPKDYEKTIYGRRHSGIPRRRRRASPALDRSEESPRPENPSRE